MSDYYAVVDGEVQGPMDMVALEAMAQLGRVTATTQISGATKPDQWFTWKELRPDYGGAKRPFEERAVNLTEVRAQVRLETAYPKLRTTLEIILWLNVLTEIICIFMCFGYPEHLTTYLAMAIGSLAGIIFLHVIFALLDLADAALRRDEGGKFHGTYR